MPQHIAILGWGSLLRDERPEFDKQHHAWLPDGPNLKLKFSRISQSRRGALTLVIDPTTNGAPCRVAYALSKRAGLEDALCDLRAREGTTRANIGCISLDDSATGTSDDQASKAIREWAKEKNVDVVLWTKLPSNFEEVCGKPFTVKAAVAHVQALDAEGKIKAAEYVWRAPPFIDTPLRRVLECDPWFPAKRRLTRTRRKRVRARSGRAG